MKTSRKIFIGFCFFCAIILIGFLIPNKGNKSEKDYIKHTETIPEFKHLKVEKHCSVSVFNTLDSSNMIEYSAHKDSNYQQPVFHMSHDTLILKGLSSSYKWKLYCKNTDSYTIKGSIKFYNKQDSIFAKIHKGHFHIVEGQESAYIDINASNSQLLINNFHQLTINASISSTGLYISNPNLKSAQITAINNSRIRLRSINNINIDKDSSSTVRADL